MNASRQFYIVILILVLVLAILIGGIFKSDKRTESPNMLVKTCQMDAEARNLTWEYRQVGGCFVLTKSGAWIPLAQFDHPSQIP